MGKNKGGSGCFCCFQNSKKDNNNLQRKPTFFKKFKNPDDPRLNDLVRRFNKYATNDKMTLEQYKRMMGVLGNTYLTERMFSAMDKDNNRMIDLEEYLTYNDIILNGSVTQKREQNFAMINDNMDTVVSYQEFETFVIRILDMYSRTVREKIDANKEMIDEIFYKIAPKGTDSFTFEQYMKALDTNPNLFIWLERPKEMLNDILNKEEGKYSKKFVDEILGLFFKYIATTEYSMKRILKYVRELKGESDTETLPDDDNLLLNIDDSLFSKGKNGYLEVIKTLTKDESKMRKHLEVNQKFNHKAKSHNQNNENKVQYLGGKSSSEGEYEEEEDEESFQNSDAYQDSEEELKGDDTSFLSDNSLTSNRNSHLDLLSNKKLEKRMTNDLMKQSDDPIENIRTIAETMVDVSRSLDSRVQSKVEKETNQRNKEAEKNARNVKTPKAKGRESPEEIYKEEEEDDLPEGREFIDFGHESFDLVFNIMLGIKRSIDCQFSFAFSNTRDYDYIAKYEYINEWFSTNTSASNQFIFIDYAPKIFEDIRLKDGVENEQYIESLGPNNIYNYIWTNDFKSFTSLVSSGKSGSLFYYSMDGKFMLKTIARDEFYKLLGTLQPYHEHLSKHPKSLLTRYYGLHKVKYKQNGKNMEQYIIIMNNMFRKFTPNVRYDLKGSTQGRSTEFKDGKIDPKIALKDNDWTDGDNTVDLQVNDKRELVKTIKADSEYLGKNQTLDYSLLLGIIDLQKLKEKDPNDPVLQYAKNPPSGETERGIYIANNKKEVNNLIFKKMF